MTSAATDREIRRVGLFIGDHSANDEKPHRPSRSSKSRPARTRRTIAARIHAKAADRSNAIINAANPGRRFANLVRKRAVESSKACFTCTHIDPSYTAHF
jgi:hypothetical protein